MNSGPGTKPGALTLALLGLWLITYGPSTVAGNERVASFTATAFIPMDSQADYETTVAGCIHRTSTDPAFLVQDVQLPEGALVNSLRLFVAEDSSTGATGISLVLKNNSLDGNVTTVAMAVADGPGTQVIEASAAHRVANDLGALTLVVELEGLGFFCAAQLSYSLPLSTPEVRSVAIDGHAFAPNRDFTSWTDFGQGCSRFNSSPPPMAFYDLQLPQGAIIETLEAHYFDADSSISGEILVRLVHRGRTELVPDVLATVSSDTNTGFGSASTTLNHQVDNQQGALYLDWSQAVSDSDLALCGVRLTYRTEAQLEPDRGVLNVAGAALVTRDSETRYRPNNGCLDQRSIEPTTIYSPFAADVQLPQGVPITEFALSFIDNDDDQDLRIALLDVDTDFTTFGADAVAEASSSGASGELRTIHVTPPFPYDVDNVNNSLSLLARLEGGGQTSSNLFLCNVSVTFGTPLPIFADGFEAAQ